MKERHLPCNVFPGVVLRRFHKALVHGKVGRPVGAQTVQSAGLNQAFHSLLIDLADFHIIDKLENVFGQTFFGSGADNGIDSPFSHILDAQKSETNPAVLYGEFLLAAVDTRRQHFNAHLLTVADIFCNGFGVSHDAGHQRRHKFHRIIFFQIAGFVGHHCVHRRMGFVEGILSKGFHIGKNRFCRRLGNPLSDTAGNLYIAVFVQLSVDKIFLFLQHDVFFLFTHGAAHDVGAAEAVACQVADNLHHLLLIHKTAVGDVQNRRKLRRYILDFARVLFVLDVLWNRVHGTRPVKGDARHHIFKTARLQVFHKLGHAAAFQLEHPQGVAACYHIVDGGVIVAHFGKVDGYAVILFYQLQGVPDYRQVPQPQKVHLQKPQLLDGRHVELGGDAFVRVVQRHIFVQGQLGNHHAGRMGGSVARHALDGF